jgi:hypothetical protein
VVLEVRLTDNKIEVGDRFALTCHRTLRVPDDGGTYPLPPGLGRFPIREAGTEMHNEFIVPLLQREALWLSFAAARWKPNAIKVGLGGTDTLTGNPRDKSLSDNPQNYMVVPDQPWLDGFNIGDGLVRQFVAVPMGTALSVEAQFNDGLETGRLEIIVFEPKFGQFPDSAPPRTIMPARSAQVKGQMSLGAGGKMRQKIYPDRFGPDTWDQVNFAAFSITLLNSETFQKRTGDRPPKPTIDAQTYTKYGLPWFDLYDEDRAYVEPSERLTEVKSVLEIEQTQSVSDISSDPSVEIDPKQIRKADLRSQNNLEKK